SLFDVYERADEYWEKLKKRWTGDDQGGGGGGVDDTMEAIRKRASEVGFQRDYGRADGEDYLVIDAIVEGFQAHRSLRRDNSDVLSLANHRLLSAAATRRGLAKVVASRIFPVGLWQAFEDPVKHFLL